MDFTDYISIHQVYFIFIYTCMKKLWLFAVAIAAVTLSGCSSSGAQLSAEWLQENTTLATCLTDTGWKMYGTERCGHCKDQKEKFGDAFASVTYIDCDAEAASCTAAWVEWYPTWVSPDGALYPGGKNLDALKSLAWC